MAMTIPTHVDERTLHGAIHGVMSRGEHRRMLERAESFLGRTTGRAKEYADRALDRFRSIDFDSLRDGVDAVRERISKRWQDDRISVAGKLLDLQLAKPKMRRWLMADERTRNLWLNDQISGYNSDFIGKDDRVSGFDHGDWRMATQGMNVGGDEEDAYQTHFDVLDMEEAGHDDVLTFTERCKIWDSWDRMHEHLNLNTQDPTSPERSLLN